MPRLRYARRQPPVAIRRFAYFDDDADELRALQPCHAPRYMLLMLPWHDAAVILRLYENKRDGYAMMICYTRLIYGLRYACRCR